MIFFAQKAFVLHDGCLLMVQKSLDDPSHPGKWEVPGGRMNDGEQIDQHILREVFEETGITIVPGQLFYLWQWTIPGREEGLKDTVVAAARCCIYRSGEKTDEHQVAEDFLSSIRWVPLSELSGIDVIPNMEPVFAEFLRKFAPAGE